MAKKKRRRLRPAFVITVLLVMTAIVLMYFTPLFAVRDIVVSGNSRLSKAEIMIASGIRKGNSIFAMSTRNAEKRVKALGYIEKVDIDRRIDMKVSIKVTEGKVCAYVMSGGAIAGINCDGLVLCVMPASVQPDAALIKGVVLENVQVGKIASAKDIKAEKFKTALKLLNSFKEYSMVEDITEIDVSESEYITFRHRDKLKVEMGSLTDYELKFNYFNALLAQMGEDVEGTLNMISENYAYSHTIQ